MDKIKSENKTEAGQPKPIKLTACQAEFTLPKPIKLTSRSRSADQADTLQIDDTCR